MNGSKSNSIPHENLFRYKGLAWLPLWLQLPVHRDVSNSVAGTGLTNNGWRLLYLEDEWYLKSWVSALTSTRISETVLLMRILVKDMKCFACSLHYTADESIPTFPGQMQRTALVSEMSTYCFFCLSAVFTVRRTKTAWWLVWRNLIFRCFSLCLAKPGSSPKRGGGAEQHRPDALRSAKGSI